MSGFGLSFNSAASAMSAIQQALDAVQNNIVNASTPGYAAQRVNFSARPFDVTQGLVGGVGVSLSSSRDEYLEQSVRSETSALGLLEQKSPLLSTLQNAFSASGDSGVPGALSSFVNSFSVLSTNPNDASARANVIQAASTLAQAFNQTASAISQVSAGAAQQASTTVSQINALATHIASLNATIQNGAQKDAGVAADLNNSLDSLSELVNVSVTHNSDGSASVLLGGQTALVLGSAAHTLTIQNSPTDPTRSELADQNGSDVTGQATQGKLGALLQVRNQAAPQYLGGLNDLANAFAGRVNTILTNGQVSTGPPPVAGSPLFTYDNTNASATLAVNSTITPDQIATIDPTPGNTTSNGVAVELANLTNPTNALDLINGQSFTAFYGRLAGQAGAASAQTTTDLQTQQDLTAQAQSQRTQSSGVSLNDQAAQLLNLQQAYQATARIITILNSLSQTAVGIIPQA